jgi:dihydroneopterin aldolase
MIIYIRDLVVSGKHGVHDHEKTTAQKFSITIEMDVATTANHNDELTNTVDWSHVRDQVVGVVENNSFNLIERLAQAVADEILKDTLVQAVTVSIDKLEAFPSGVPGVRLEVKRA